MTPERDSPPEAAAVFRPLRPAPRTKLAMLLWPLVWVVALLVLAAVVHRGDAVELALIVALVSFVLALASLTPQRFMRARRESRR
jgi:hypothetical protein